MGASDIAMTLLSVILVCLLVSPSSAYSMDLATLLKQHQAENQVANKRNPDQDGNPCPSPDAPFPCKDSSTCISVGYLCDDSCDCESCYDEDVEVCTAVHRPPVVDIMRFLDMEKGWIVPALFHGKPIAKIAHGLAVSQTVDDFKRRLGISKHEADMLREALDAVKHRDIETLEHIGMPSGKWHEVNFIFSKLVKSGFQ